MIVIYLIIAFLATFFGSLVGLGGGVIVKPVLDLLNQFDVATISVLSSTTIFAMTIVTIFMNLKNGLVIERRLFAIAGGAVIGGYIGKVLLGQYIQFIGSDSLAKGIQAIMLGLIMILIYFLISRDDYSFSINNVFLILLIGVILGTLSSFLGIGGGPLNVIILVMYCGVEKKYAAFASVFLIFASQGTKILSIILQGSYHLFNPYALVGLIPGAILGGFYGSKLYRRLDGDVIIRVFRIAIILLAILNFFVAYRFLAFS